MDKIEEVLTRRVDKVYPSPKALGKALRGSKKLKLYMGIDPTNSRLHLGHTVGLRKLMEFANLGHEVIFLFGTGTVLVGDPSLRDEGRKLITEEEIEKNIKNWKEQTAPIVDFSKIKIMRNDEWLTKLKLKDIIEIGSKISAVQLFKRKSFTRRLKKGDTVWYHETMYPLLQGYDSVAMDVDLEIGGTDQTFNMLVGRELQKKFNNKEKYVLTVRMIEGTDGAPMSKTRGNCIWLTDSASDMFAKVMAVVDRQIGDYFEFFTDMGMGEIREIRALCNAQGKIKGEKAMKLKKDLAFRITKQFHGEKEAEKAKKSFKRVVQKGKKPKKIPTFEIENLPQNPINIVDLIVDTGLAKSKSEAKRLVRQKAVEYNGKKILSRAYRQAGYKDIKILSDDVLRVGKRRWIKFL